MHEFLEKEGLSKEADIQLSLDKFHEVHVKAYTWPCTHGHGMQLDTPLDSGLVRNLDRCPTLWAVILQAVSSCGVLVGSAMDGTLRVPDFEVLWP